MKGMLYLGLKFDAVPYRTPVEDEEKSCLYNNLHSLPSKFYHHMHSMVFENNVYSWTDATI